MAHSAVSVGNVDFVAKGERIKSPRSSPEAAVSQRIAAVKREIEDLRAAIELKKRSLTDGGLSSVPILRRPLGRAPIRRKSLSGHFNKVHALQWAHKSNNLISVGQDSKLILWDAFHAYKLEDSVVGWGGMDNVVSFCRLSRTTESAKRKELHGHDGYVSAVRFNTEDSIISSSGDSTCILWDLTRMVAVHKYTDHSGDVMALSPNPTDPYVFVSASIDSTARVWDTRTTKCVQTFIGHQGDINCVEFMPSGRGFGTSGEDAAVLIFDIRSCSRVNEMIKEDTIVAQGTSLAFSRSGRVVFSGHDDCNVYAWDVLDENPVNPVFTLGGHTYRVSCAGVNHTGEALCTGSWDTQLLVRLLCEMRDTVKMPYTSYASADLGVKAVCIQVVLVCGAPHSLVLALATITGPLMM